ncbi:hypothetical protein GOV07_05590 [Candidatus Woesearchaeota archaeon]|nr:hypothetical protein [Candidatus Woesearchaeota archaeon]
MPLSERLIKIIGIYSLLFVSVFGFIVFAGPFNAAEKASAMMLAGLILIWIVLCGSLMYLFRKPIAAVMKRIPINWKLRFVLFATVLALFEEAITVAMTNLAPVFGSTVAEAHITASANYLHTVLFHSVIVFIPMFICWAFLLGRYDFTPPQVFLLFGLTGVLAEILISPYAWFNGFWIFVYGLMIFLPTYSIPERDVKKPRWYHFLLAIILPLLCALPIAIIVIAVKEALGIVLFV